jgi:hypothetical protein
MPTSTAVWRSGSSSAPPPSSPENGDSARAASDEASRMFSGCGGWKNRPNEARSVVSLRGQR